MDINELKSEMMRLWKDTFHDSDKYISLVFDNYFDPEFVEYREEGGRLISMLLGVPYTFGAGSSKINGVYMCGLSTVEEYRHRGIMKELMDKFNERMKAKGFAFTFLIPATESLRLYYAFNGYDNAMYLVEDRYTDIHDFKNDYITSLSEDSEQVMTMKEAKFDAINVRKLLLSEDGLVVKTADYIQKSEESCTSYVGLLHSQKDIMAVLNENIISGGEIYVSFSGTDEVSGVAFITFDERKRIHVPKVYYDDKCTQYKLLDHIKRTFQDLSMSVSCYPEETDRRALWSKYYGAANPDGSGGGSYGMAERVYDVNRHARPYGMTRILNIREILKFIARHRSDCKFSILVKEVSESQILLKCDVSRGKAVFTEIDGTNLKPRNNGEMTLLSKKNLASIIFRKKDTNSMIMEALGIPRLGLNMSLLLD